ncbi:transmembrane protein 201-like isoform X1 [Biomphalaria glabrata]
MKSLINLRNKFLRSISSSEVTVNCWFCNENNRITRAEKQSWICSHCEQYNGFTEDGGYNQDLSEQYNVKDYKTKPLCSSMDSSETEVSLCKSCSQNQVMKVRQLADFTPFHEINYDQEIDMYKDYLEHLYSLCQTCEAKVNNFLCQQDLSLMSQLDDSLHHRLADLSRDINSHIESEQKSSQGSYSILMSRIMLAQSSLCSAFLSIVNLRLLAGSMSMSSSTAISSYLAKASGFLVTTIPGPLALDMGCNIAFIGVALCLCGLYWAGKYSYYPEDVIHILLWLLTVIVLSFVDVSLLWNLCLNISTMGISILCCLKNRKPRNITSASVQRKDLLITIKPNKSDSYETSLTSGEPLKSNPFDQAGNVEPLPQHETVRQNLESVSLGLGKRSGSSSSSSIWCLPFIVTSSSSPSPSNATCEFTPDSSSDQVMQRKGVLSPSRLGFLSYDPYSPSKAKSSDLSRSESPWSPISTFAACKNSPELLTPQPISRTSSWQQRCPSASKSDSHLGPCDSQGDISSASNRHLKRISKETAAAESTGVCNQKEINQSFTAPKPLAPRRSSRIAMAGRQKKPWPLQKSYSCTSAFDFYNGEKAGHSYPPEVANLKNVIFNHGQPECMTKVSDNVTMTDKQKKPKTSSKNGNTRHQDLRVTSKFGLSEMSDDENWEFNKTGYQRKEPKYRADPDFSWKWMFLGLVIGVSVTINVFLLCCKQQTGAA